MGAKNVKNLIVKLINFVALLPGLLLIYRIYDRDPDFFTFSGNAFIFIGTGLMLLYLALSAASKAVTLAGKFFWWLPMGSFIALMIFLINIIPAAIFTSFPEESVVDMTKTSYVPHFLILLLVWVVCDVFTFSYVYPDPNNKK